MRGDKNGVITLSTNSEAGKQIQERLSEEHTLMVISQLLGRIDTLEKAVSHLTTIIQQGPGLVAMAGDMVDEAYRKADANGLSVENRIQNALTLAEKLTQPAMVEQLNGLMKLADQMPGLVAMSMDIIDEQMKLAVANGFDPQSLAETASMANNALTSAKAEPPAKVGGLFGIIRMLRDPDRQKGLGFLMNFLKYFGRNF